MPHWERHGIAVRRPVLLLMGGLLLAAGFAGDRNPWNFRVFETTFGHPVTLVSLATIVLDLELSLTFRSFLVWTLACGAACYAVAMLCAALGLSLFRLQRHAAGPEDRDVSVVRGDRVAEVGGGRGQVRDIPQVVFRDSAFARPVGRHGPLLVVAPR